MKLALVGALLVACSHPPPPDAPDPPPGAVTATTASATDSPETKTAIDAIVRVFELLTSTSVMIGDHTQIAEAGVAGLGFKSPIPWTTEPSRDRDLMRGAIRAMTMHGQLPAGSVLRAARAMALASGDAQTFAVDRAGLAALYGLVGGVPVTQLGLVVHQQDDKQWAATTSYGAARAAGVQPGDTIVAVDGTPVTHGWRDFAYLLGRPVGTAVKLDVVRAGAPVDITARLAAATGPIVESRVLPGGAIGYVHVWACTHADDPKRDAAALVQRALADFDRRRVKQLVIDLRGNAGGFPFDLASLLVDADPLLYAVPAAGEPKPIARTKLAAWKTKRAIAVIVDEATASGAEMLALILRDHAAATLVGTPTAGGLTFPTTAQLPDDITLSYPESRVGNKDQAVQDGNRLVPDVVVGNPSAADDAANRDPQLAAAIDAVTKAS
ncbi:MAG TPA: S41 family peptidase [Kofleriaceae bacterium]|jgi:carboxyl-terminal processing protease